MSVPGYADVFPAEEMRADFLGALAGIVGNAEKRKIFQTPFYFLC